MTTKECAICANGYWGRLCDRKCPPKCECCNISHGTCELNKCRLTNATNKYPQTNRTDFILVDVFVGVCLGVFLLTGIGAGAYRYIQRKKLPNNMRQMNTFQGPDGRAAHYIARTNVVFDDHMYESCEVMGANRS